MKDSIKKAVKERAKSCCEYCKAQLAFSGDTFSIEHIMPTSKGGETVLDNLAFSCQCCNNHKYTATFAIDPITGDPSRLYNPRQDSWEDNFEWDEFFIEIIGISPIGRATVNRLKINRAGLKNIRKILFEAGLHPPINY